MAVLAFNFEGAFYEQAFEKQFMTRSASIFSEAVRHTTVPKR